MTEQVIGSPEKSPRYANCMEEVTALIKGRAPLIWVLTHEESRFIGEFSEVVAEPLKRTIWLWSAYQGLVRNDQQLAVGQATGEEKGSDNPRKALARIAEMTKASDSKGLVYILRDFHTVLGEPIPRQIRDMYEHLISSGKTLLITSPMLAHGPGGGKPGLPPTLEKQISVVNFELPNRKIIAERVEEVIVHMRDSIKGKNKKTELEYTEDDKEVFAKALQGMTAVEIDTSLATSVTHMNKLCTEKLINDKRQIIRKSQILEFIDTPVGMSDVGGLGQAKEYLGKYSKAYSDEAKAFGVEPIKGVLLTGVPGTGKSLLAKAIGKMWKVPLLRLDVGKVMTGLVGGSEQKMREVIDQAEAMAPCVLWIDEVEKSLSGTKSSNFSDGGTLARVFGTLLTAMQDGMQGVTIIATANDITMLPPEFIRRFNEVFFVDLPSEDERWEVLEIHLRKRGRDIKMFDNNRTEFLKASDGYTGAEIEKAVKDAIAAAFYAGKKDVGVSDLTTALDQTKPISQVMADKILKIREKARGQYRFASKHAEEMSLKRQVTTKSNKKLDLNDALDNVSEIKSKKEQSKDTKTQAGNRFADVVKE